MQFQSASDGPGVFSSFRAFRLFKIFRLFRVGDLRILLDSITFTLTTIGDYVILLLLFIYVFSLIGMSFFAGYIKFDENDMVDIENGTSPRAHYDTLGWSVITIFQVLLGEGWNDIMYSAMRCLGGFSAVYFVGLVISGNIIMLNLFLAILLGNFDKARNFGQKKKVFEAFREIMNDGLSLNETIDVILGDMSMHVKSKILKWDMNQVQRLHSVGDTKLGEELMEEYGKFMALKDAELKQNKNKNNHSDEGMSDNSAVSANEFDINPSKSIIKPDYDYESQTSVWKPMEPDQKFRYKRLRELNRQLMIKPFVGLPEILSKANLNTIRPLPRSIVEVSLAYRHSVKKAQMRQKFTKETNMNQNFGSLSKDERSKEEQESDEEISESEQNQSENNEANQGNQEDRKLYKKSKSMFGSQPNMDFSKNNDFDKASFRSMKVNKDVVLEFQSVRDDVKKSANESHSTDSEQALVDSRTYTQKIKDHLKNSSCYIFHQDWAMRQKLLLLVETPENLDKYHELRVRRQGVSKKDESQKKDDKNMMMSKIFQKEEGKKIKQAQHPSKTFDNVILMLICLSSILLAIDNPLYDPNSKLVQVVAKIDIGFTCLFTLEAAIKIIAKGFLYNDMDPIQPYIRSVWNTLDFFVVVSALIDLVFTILGIDMQSLQALKALRALRALRPLRVISKNEGMRLVVNALLASIPSMTNVLLVCTLFILIFSIMGVNYFKGMFFYCSDSMALEPLNYETILTKQDCLDQGGKWVNNHANFDNTVNAMSTLFQMMTTEGWVNVMENGIDSVGIDKQPKQNYNVWLIFYFIAFMIIGSQFIINLFVGVVIDNFNTIKEKEELGNMFVTEQQRSWIEIQKICQGKKLRIKIKEPKNFQKYFFRLVNNNYFEYSITFFIFLNTIVMAIKHYRMSEGLEHYSEMANYVFTIVFNFEAVLKLIGMGKIYFMYTWNTFDLVIVIATDMGLIMKFFNLGSSFSSAATVIRGFRIMRMFKLIRSSVHIRLILDTVFNILPQISNVLSLIMLLFFIYAALGINLFSGVMLQDNLDSKNNFQTFPAAMIILMKFSTGEDWNAFMYELASKEGFMGQDCLEIQTYKDIQNAGGEIRGCGTIISYPYFLSFTILVSMLIMNLSVAAVIEGLDTAKKENMGVVQGDEIEQLIDKWQDYDQMATGWITMKDLVFLLYELPPPLGKRSEKFNADNGNEKDGSKGMRQQDRYLVNEERGFVIKKIDALELLKDLKIKVHQDAKKQVHFVDVVKALLKRIFVDKQIDYKLSPKLNNKIKNQWDKKHKEIKNSKSTFTAQQEHAGAIITKWAKAKLNSNIKRVKKTGKREKEQGKEKEKKKDGDNKESLQAQRQQFLKEQAKVIYNIIHNVEDFDNILDNQTQNKYFVKNTYSWKKLGGHRLLNDVSRSSTPTKSDSVKVSQTLNVPNKMLQINMFGPQSLKKIREFEMQKEDQRKDTIQINFSDLETSTVKFQQKQLYVLNEGEEPKRDPYYEKMTILMEQKNQAVANEHQRMFDVPDLAKNVEDANQKIFEQKQKKRKQRDQVIQKFEEKLLMPDHCDKREVVEFGTSRNTIQMDPRFIDADNYNEMIKFQKGNASVGKESMLDEILTATLPIKEKVVEDLKGSKMDSNIEPSRARSLKQKNQEEEKQLLKLKTQVNAGSRKSLVKEEKKEELPVKEKIQIDLATKLPITPQNKRISGSILFSNSIAKRPSATSRTRNPDQVEASVFAQNFMIKKED